MKEKKNLIFKAKITPKKIGQFASIWKRNNQNVTIPYDFADHFQYMVIELENDKGKFIFPKNILLEKGIISGQGSDGKNGMRVYSPSDKTISKQAVATKKWQSDYFYL